MPCVSCLSLMASRAPEVGGTIGAAPKCTLGSDAMMEGGSNGYHKEHMM